MLYMSHILYIPYKLLYTAIHVVHLQYMPQPGYTCYTPAIHAIQAVVHLLYMPQPGYTTLTPTIQAIQAGYTTLTPAVQAIHVVEHREVNLWSCCSRKQRGRKSMMKLQVTHSLTHTHTHTHTPIYRRTHTCLPTRSHAHTWEEVWFSFCLSSSTYTHSKKSKFGLIHTHLMYTHSVYTQSKKS